MPRPKVRPENRQRACRACIACKASKIRCDARDPCGSCLRRDRGSSCVYSGVDRRRKNLKNLRNVTFVPKPSSALVNARPTCSASPDALDVPTEHPSAVEQASVALNPSGESVAYTATDQGSGSYVSNTAGQGYIGSVPFTEDAVHHVAVDTQNSDGDSLTHVVSFDERCSLLESYFEATSGILDLFSANELEELWVEDPHFRQNTLSGSSRVSTDLKAIFDLVFAIGAQTRGSGNTCLQLANSYFLRARATAFDGMLITQTLDTVRLFTLLTFYTLGTCNRNAASIFLSIATKAAVILNLQDAENCQKLPEEVIRARIRIRDSVQNLDTLTSFIFGRPRNLPAIYHESTESAQIDTKGGRCLPPRFAAMVKVCGLLDRIVDTLGKNSNILNVPAAEELLKQLRQWSRDLPRHIRQFPATSDLNLTLQPADNEAFLGSLHISGAHYFAVLLITRPFLVAYLMSRLRGKAPDDLIGDPDEASDIRMKNSEVSRLAQVCVSSAIEMVEMCENSKHRRYTFGNFCFLEAWVFGAGLVLGFSMFAGEPRKDIDRAFDYAQSILREIGTKSPQAQLYHNILDAFVEAIKKYKQRVTDERNYTVQYYMDRVLISEASPAESSIGEEGSNPIPPDSDIGWQSHTTWTIIREGQVFYFSMLEMTQLMHSSRFTNPRFLPSILVQSTVARVKAEDNPKVGPVSEKQVPLSSVISILDFEVAASQNLASAAFAFIKSGAEDENTARWNRDSWKLIRFRPRILRPINDLDISRTILGAKFDVPFFICPAGGAKLVHPEADLCLTRAAGRHHTLHWVCNNSHISQHDMSEARAPGQTTFWQIYPRSELDITTQEVKQAVRLGYKGFALTVDAVRAGKRERDLRVVMSQRSAEGTSPDDEEGDDGFAGEPSVGRPAVQSGLDWFSAIKWLREITELPIAIKGIQCWEDAKLCMEYGAHPWLSNHGGRQLDSTPSAAETLVSMRQHCPEIFEKCEVIVDGGITRGADIVKAIALGARAVGLGRPFLYAAAFGEAGASKAIRILKNEIETTMALLGLTSLEQLDPSYVRAPHFSS
ncbi:hypothetical protein BO82DRAFT_381401 [Aspergillus uvarum CBS 121591]|uniref:Zn(2)-C6 fungal-type domain-containing protein n=1 Tax=Aspergillus uvarum CBS 121591 TaxID=1448315 RepID=A0A319D9D2_9EURO|nr:hypothetical protein BO82DRAFT_381401 [Aspergillus uvarum CBS 121591]PYH84598.1 hypothetical protein BO82DRAFT_381401 [Aspergillus uvarum CBS 121591]